MSPELPPSMQGLGQCEKHNPCEYHKAKVAPVFTGLTEVGLISQFPPSSVWGKEHIQSISQSVHEGTVVEALQRVQHYWVTHAVDLNGPLYEAWNMWQKNLKEKGNYGAGGWAASPQQLSQYVETIKALKKQGVDTSKVLRLGTASGVHTQQEVFALQLAGEKYPKMTIADLCVPPLAESLTIAPDNVESVSVSSVLSLPPEWKNMWSIITTHFLEVFLPTQEQYEDGLLDHKASIDIKKNHFHQVYSALKPGGWFISTVGVSPAANRFQSKEEILDSLMEAGFMKNNIVLVPTTDPFDFDHVKSKHIPGNYFVVAQKGGV